MWRAIKVYGERNTGTNYLEQLLELNVDLPRLPGVVPSFVARLDRGAEASRDAWFRLTRRWNLGWKHQAAPTPAQRASWRCGGVLFVTLTKNPYSWALSMHRRPYHRGGTVPDLLTFLRTPWPALGRDNVGDALPTPIDLWNVKNASYLALAGEAATVNLTYEDLLRDPQVVIDRLVEVYGLPRRHPSFVNVERSTKQGGGDFEGYRAYYLQERWREKLGREHVEAVDARLDAALARRFGYAAPGATEAA